MARALGWLVTVASVASVACAGGDRSDDAVPSGAALEEGADPDGTGGEPAAPTPQPSPATGPTRADVEPETPPPAEAPPMQRAVEVIELVVTPVEATEGEDGRGATVPADDPLALDLRAAEGFGGRARDPVLHVGQLRFHRYSHPAPDTLRFVVASGAALPEGAEVALQYGDDEGSRVVVTESLEVPR